MHSNLWPLIKLLQPPNQTQVLIIGGGPAGSYTATLLSKAGFDVVVLEATKFPRCVFIFYYRPVQT